MEQIKKFFQTNFFHTALVLVLCAVLAAVSLWRLPASPATWFDEGINLGIAKSLVNNGVYSLQVGPQEFVNERPFLITSNYPVLAPVVAAIYLGGLNFTASRVPMVLFLWLFAALAYFLVKRLYGKQNALLSLALIVTFVPFYGNGKVVLGEVPGLVYFMAGLLVWPKVYQPRRLFIAGLLFGLSAATKPFFLIIAPALFLGEIYRHYWFGKDPFWKRIVWIAGGALPPLVFWLYTILPHFSWSGVQEILGYYSNSYAATGFGAQVFTNVKRFFTETTPIHFMLLGIVVAVVFFARVRRRVSLEPTELVLLAFIGINFLWYLKTPGWYRYFFTAHLLLFLFFPAAISALLSRWRAIALSLVVILVFVQFGYLLTKRHDALYNSASAENIATIASQAMAADQTILVVNAPSVAFLLPSNRVYQYLQINPVLHFGWPDMKDKANRPFAYVLLNGTPDPVPLPGLADVLKRSYVLVSEDGHYALYRNRL